MLDDLPMFLGHEILTSEQRTAIKHAYTPIKLGVKKLLRQYQVRLLEQALSDFLGLRDILRLEHATRK